MWSGLESVAVIFLIFAVGFVLAIRKIWPASTPNALAFIVVRIAAPCLAITSITAYFSRELLVRALVLLFIAALHILILFALGKLLSKGMDLRKGKKVIFEVTFTFSNVIFVGLPINRIVFGPEGTPFLFMYYIVILTAFWSFGEAQIAAAANRENGNNTDNKLVPKSSISLKKIFNPGFIGVLIGAAMAYLGWQLPSVIDIALGHMAALTVPLSLLVIGANLVIFAKGISMLHKDEAMILLGKFVISPLVMFVLLKIFGVTGLPFFVFILTSSMPCHMQTSILAQHYNVESEYASRLVGLSTLLSIITIPAYAALIHYFM
jgi:predicted permease